MQTGNDVGTIVDVEWERAKYFHRNRTVAQLHLEFLELHHQCYTPDNPEPTTIEEERRISARTQILQGYIKDKKSLVEKIVYYEQLLEASELDSNKERAEIYVERADTFYKMFIEG